MRSSAYVRIVSMLACFVFAAASPAAAAPMAGLHYLVGTWKCTYRGGAERVVYDATYSYDLDGHSLRQVDSYAGGGGAEELIAYDAQHAVWKSIVFDDHGNTTVMRGIGSDPNHVAYRSVYPDTSIAVTFDRVSAKEYALHATVLVGGKKTTSVDTCRAE